MQTLSEQFEKWPKMAAAQEDAELAPSHEQNEKYMCKVATAPARPQSTEGTAPDNKDEEET